LLLIGVFALMYFLVIRPQSQRRKQMSSMQSAVEEGAPVMTLGGLYGTVVSTGDDTVVVQVSPGVTNTYARQAIAKVLSDEDAIKAGLAPSADEVDEVEDVVETDEIVEAPGPVVVEPVDVESVGEPRTSVVSDPTAPAALDTPKDSTDRH
jgi:preprotein translocase subunit YajC